ncbi:glycosyltransferase family 4 protein [Candidatus Sumerlaeota bacterium]|nr:glycosyltransferase family 4 protein [Candidatus Sumerlaeota bacterium]
MRDEYVRQGLFAREDRLSVIYHLPPQIGDTSAVAPPPAEWQLPAAEPVVTFVGKISLGKGAHILLEAIPRVLERHPTAVFVFAGRPTPQIRTSPTNIAPQSIRWLGHLPWSQVQALLARSSLVVMPSVCFEGLGRVVIEANSAGVPVVASRRGGIPELIVERESGWLVEPGDAGALAERIAAALDDPARLHRMGELARGLLRERFDPDKITSDVLAVYQAAISGHTLPL